MTGAIVGVLLLTVNPIGGRSMWSGCEMMPPSSRPGSRLWRGSLLLATRHAGRRKAASAPAIHLLSAPLTIPPVCCDSNGFRRVSRGGEAMARRQKEERRVGSASRGMVRRLGCCSSCVRHRVVPERGRVPERCNSSGSAMDACSDTTAGVRRAERAADGGVVCVSRALSVSPRALRIHAQRVARCDPVWSKYSCGLALVVFQEPSEPLMALHRAISFAFWAR
jgi:hypothetical protein